MQQHAPPCDRRSESGGALLLALAVVLMSVVPARASDQEIHELRTLASTPGSHHEIVRLRNDGVPPDVPDSEGRTAFHDAVMAGDLQNLAALLHGDGSPNLDVQDANGDTALHLVAAAAATNDMDDAAAFQFTKILLEAGANPCVENERRCNVWDDTAAAAPARTALELVMDAATCRGDPKRFKRILGCLDRRFTRPFSPYRPPGGGE